jgi:LPXTG-motif cell wall-anchored protein
MPRVLSNAEYSVNHRRKTGLEGIAQFAILPYREQTMDPNTTVKLIAGILAVALVAIIILRRKKKKGATDDEF